MQTKAILLAVVVFFNIGQTISVSAGETKQGEVEAEKLPRRAVARLGSTAFAQEEIIHAVALSPDGKQAATADSGEFHFDDQRKPQWNFERVSIRFWDVPEGKSPRQIAVKDGPVLTLDYSPNGKTLAAGVGGMAITWDIATGKEIHRFRFDDYASQVRFTADGEHLLVNLSNRKFVQCNLQERTQKILWDRKKLADDIYVADTDLSSDGKRLAILLGKEVEMDKRVVPLPPHRLQVLELPDGKVIFEAENKEFADCLALAPDKKTIIFGSERLGLWDIEGNKKARELPAVLRPTPPGVDAKWRTWKLAAFATYSPDGKVVATIYDRGRILLWDAASGKKIGDYFHAVERRSFFHASDVLAFSRDSKWLALGGSQVLRIVDIAAGKEISSWPGHRMSLLSFRFAPDGRRLFTYNQTEICAWESKEWKQLYARNIMPTHDKIVLAESFEKDLLIHFEKGEYLLEDLATGKVLAKFPVKDQKFDGAGFSFEGKTCCLENYTEDKTYSAVFFSIPDCKELFSLKLKNVTGCYFSPVRNSFNWLDEHGVRFEADGLTGKITNKLDLTGKSFDPKNPPTLSANTIFSWDGKYLLNQSIEPSGQIVRIWDVDVGRTTHRLQFAANRVISGIDFTFDSRLMVYAQNGRNGVCVLELASGKERRSLLYSGQANPKRIVTSPTNYAIAAGRPGNTVVVWDLARPSGKLTKARLTDEELDAFWRNLADANAIIAEDAIESLVQFPSQAVPLLKGRLKPVPPLAIKHINSLIEALSSEELAIREKALSELESQLERAESTLRKTLEAGKQSPETRRMIEEVLGKPLPPADADTLRSLRAIEVLEKIGTPEARDAIEPLTRGAAGARVTQDAVATLSRLKR